MRIKDVTASAVEKTNDLESLFNIYENNKSQLFYNLNSTLYIDVDPNSSILKHYQVKGRSSWTKISYDLYGTTHLWWLILKCNGITDATTVPENQIVSYLPAEYLTKIVEQINN